MGKLKEALSEVDRNMLKQFDKHVAVDLLFFKTPMDLATHDHFRVILFDDDELVKTFNLLPTAPKRLEFIRLTVQLSTMRRLLIPLVVLLVVAGFFDIDWSGVVTSTIVFLTTYFLIRNYLQRQGNLALEILEICLQPLVLLFRLWDWIRQGPDKQANQVHKTEDSSPV